jgi:hypothetical protein
MFKNPFARLFLTTPTSPLDLFGIRCRQETNTDNSIKSCRLRFHNGVNTNLHLLRQCSTTTSSAGPNPVPKSKAVQELKNLVNVVTKCGIAKDFGASPEEILQQQQQKERNIFGDDGLFYDNSNLYY